MVTNYSFILWFVILYFAFAAFNCIVYLLVTARVLTNKMNERMNE